MEKQTVAEAGCVCMYGTRQFDHKVNGRVEQAMRIEPSKEQLLKAGMAELSYVANSPEAKALTEQLLNVTLEHEAKQKLRRQSWRVADLKAFRSGLEAFTADLLIHAGNLGSAGTMYRSTNRASFTGTNCSNRHFERLLKLWSAMGWVEIYRGFQKISDFDGDAISEFARARRIRAMPAFINIAENHGVVPDNARNHFAKDHQKTQPVEVRSRSQRDAYGKKRSKRLRPPKSSAFDTALSQVRDLNQFLERRSFSLPETPQFKRTFNNGDDPSFNYNLGGRLYCVSAKNNYQNLHKSERLGILIDGEASAEVDVSNSFLAIVHWLCEESFDPTVDLYDIDGIERYVVKKIVVARLASDDWPKQWPKGFKSEYRKATGVRLERRYKLKDVVAEVKRNIPILNRIDQSKNGWAQLQYWESEAIIGAILDLKDNHNVVALPIHDSLLVARSSVTLAKDALTCNYKFLFGFSPNLKVRSQD